MKSTELFDLLSEIDDKFYIEARIPDEQHGVEVVSEHRPIRGFLGIFLPIAACVAIIAAVAVGASFVKRNAGILPPNYPDSDLSSDAPFTSDMVVSSYDMSSTSSGDSSVPPVVDDKEIRLEDYPPIDLDNIPELEGGGLLTQIEHQDEKLQKATLETLKCGDYELHMLGRYIHVNDSNDPNGKLYSYYVTLAVSKDGKVISSDSTHTSSVSMGQDGFILDLTALHCFAEMGDNIYLEYYELNGANLVIFKYRDYDITGKYEATFFTITADGELRVLMGDRSGIGGGSMEINALLEYTYTIDAQANTLTNGNNVYMFHVENFGLNPYDAVHYTTSIVQLDLSEYPAIDISEIPDVEDDFYDTTNAIPKATLAQKQVGEYTLSIIGETVRKQGSQDPRIMVDEVRSVISRDGRIIRITGENGTGIKTLIQNGFTELLPDAYEMKDGIVFGLDKKSISVAGTPSFGMIKDDVMFEFAPPTLGFDERDPFEGMVAPADESVVLIAEENALILDNIRKYVFDFDNVTYSETIIEAEEKKFNFNDYEPFDENLLNEVQPQVILDVKETAEYRFYLLGDDVKVFTTKEYTHVNYKKMLVVVEKNGEIVAQADMDNTSIMLRDHVSEFLQPFEMKDGKGFIMYYYIELWGDHEAMLYKLENDTITKLRYEYDFAPAPATGSPQYVGSDFKVVPESNTIVHDKGTLTIDFANNTFSMS